MTNPSGLGENADSIYASLIALHEGLDPEESAALDARLILLLLNEVGDEDRLNEIFLQARKAAS